jgi:uracil-DNA glycosylase family 4
MDNLRANYLRELEILNWQPRHADPAQPQDSVVAPPETVDLSSWEPLKQAVVNCTACGLHSTRTQTVFGVGNPNADLLFIGEAPGFNEDQQGEPFVGRGGQLLTAMIKTMGLTRNDVYIANILKCRPPNNRDPLPEEVNLCTRFLTQQIALIKPRIVVAVGRIAAHYLLQTKSSLESLRNKVHQYGANATPLIVTYHPAYLLRNPVDKKKAYIDLQFIQRTLGVSMHGRDAVITEQAV